MEKLNRMRTLLGLLCIGLSLVAGTAQVAATNNATLLCDTDGNGSIDLSDANNVLKYALKIITIFPDAKVNADADCDGEITLQDANLTLRYALKIIDGFPAEPEYMEPNAELLKKYGNQIFDTLSLDVLAKWVCGDISQKQAEERANVIVRNICGVVYHVKWFPFNQEEESMKFWKERQDLADKAGFSSFTMQIIGKEDLGWFLVYF